MKRTATSLLPAAAITAAMSLATYATPACAATTYQLTAITQTGATDGPVAAAGDSTNTNLWHFDASVDTLVNTGNRTGGPKRIDLGHTGDGDGNTLRLAQTFQADSTFTVNNIQLLVWNVVPNQQVHFRLFSVDDTNATAYPTSPSTVLWNGTFTQTEPNNITLFNAYLLSINLSGSDAFTLPASSGDAGYAFEMFVDATTDAGYLQWEAAVFDPVPNGVSLKYFSDGSSGQYGVGRAFDLSLSQVPEPASASLALLGLGGLVMLRRRRDVSSC